MDLSCSNDKVDDGSQIFKILFYFRTKKLNKNLFHDLKHWVRSLANKCNKTLFIIVNNNETLANVLYIEATSMYNSRLFTIRSVQLIQDIWVLFILRE